MSYYGPLPWQSLASKERYWRREEKKALRARGLKVPKLAQIGLVELAAISVPDWARSKAIRGLALTDKSVWLSRVPARRLMREDEAAGGKPKIAWTTYRRCKICQRPLLGLEAERRQQLDKKWEGARILCGPDCSSYESAIIESQQQVNRQHTRKGK
jgi:hypothetical protein